MKTFRFKEGTRLINEGEESQKMFVIQDGKARVYKTYMGKKVTLAILGQGEVFGELSFFDAAPRSASVEALTDLEALMIEGESAQKEIASMPAWIMPILRATFQRFRDADHKIMLLQSMNEYQKKVFKVDRVGRSVYLELLRFIKTFQVLCETNSLQGPIRADSLYQEMDDMLGTRMINLRMFWKQLHEHGMIESSTHDPRAGLQVQADSIAELTAYLAHEVQLDRYLLLSHTSVAILRKIVSISDAAAGDEGKTVTRLTLTQLNGKHFPFFDESIRELVKHEIVRVEGAEVLIEPEAIQQHYVYQDILKGFDHSTMSVE